MGEIQGLLKVEPRFLFLDKTNRQERKAGEVEELFFAPIVGLRVSPFV
jgi:hypothetical protein